jgi:hypothetical protein
MGFLLRSYFGEYENLFKKVLIEFNLYMNILNNMANNIVAMAMPLVSFPLMELLKHTINSSKNLESFNKKKLINLLGNIKVAPAASCMTIQKDNIMVEIYMDLEDINYDINKNIKEVCDGLDQKMIEEIIKTAANLILFVNMYYEAIKDRTPDVFKTIKNTLNLENNDSFEGVFVNSDRKMYFDPNCSMCIVPKFKRSTT